MPRRRVYDEYTGGYIEEGTPQGDGRGGRTNDAPRPCHYCGCRHFLDMGRVVGGMRRKRCRNCGAERLVRDDS